jgi:RNA polymerase sigma factor (sigma-70 family)
MSRNFSVNGPVCNAVTPDLEKGTTNPRRSPLTEAQRRLALQYLPMARALAKPLKAAWPVEVDEFESAACLALVEAAQSFDPARNVKFATFARYRIWGALRDVQRSLIKAGWKEDLENAPQETSLTITSEEHGRVLNAEPDPPVGAELEAIDAVEHWLRKLPKPHAAACRQIYINDRTQAEAAQIVGCSKSRLSTLHKEAIEMLNDAWRWKNPTGRSPLDAE